MSDISNDVAETEPKIEVQSKVDQKTEQEIESDPNREVNEIQKQREIQSMVESVTGIPIVKKTKLTGANRKRYRILLEYGIEDNEARHRAVNKIMITPEERRAHFKQRNKIRNKAMKNMKKQDDKEKKRIYHPRFHYIAPHLLNVNNGPYEFHRQFQQEPKKVTNLCHIHFPSVFLVRTHMRAIKKNLTRCLKSAPSNVIILEIIVDIGWIQVGYRGEHSMAWLKSTMDSMEPWNGVSLKTVDQQDFPVLRIFYLNILNVRSIPNAVLIKNLRKFNPNLNLNSWRVLNRYQQGPISVVIFTMNINALEALQKADFVVKYKKESYTMVPYSESNKNMPIAEEMQVENNEESVSDPNSVVDYNDDDDQVEDDDRY